MGQVLGDRYRLEELIGRGGMSTVWRAADAVLGRQVAVKVLAGASLARQSYRSSIRTDARAAASLAHPNVAAIFDYGEYTDSFGEQIPYVVMELLCRRPLSQRLQDGPLEPPVALRVCAQIAGALAAAHARGLAHRDIKPGNVVLTPGSAKVIDFGLAAPVGQLDAAPGAAAYLSYGDQVEHDGCP
jgi:eukaryotic-like serine/threonine-protein kinase